MLYTVGLFGVTWPVLVVSSWSLRHNLAYNFGGGVGVGAKSTMVVRNSDTSVLHPGKRKVFSFFCLYTTQIIVLKKIHFFIFSSSTTQ
jgi:hypothetical protein